MWNVSAVWGSAGAPRIMNKLNNNSTLFSRHAGSLSCTPSHRWPEPSPRPCQLLETSLHAAHMETQTSDRAENSIHLGSCISLFLLTLSNLPICATCHLLTVFLCLFLFIPFSLYPCGQQSLQPIWHWLTRPTLSEGRSIVTNAAHGSYIKRIKYGCCQTLYRPYKHTSALACGGIIIFDRLSISGLWSWWTIFLFPSERSLCVL